MDAPHLSLAESGADQEQYCADDDYPMRRERSGSALQLDQQPGAEEPVPNVQPSKEATQPPASTDGFLLNALADVIVSDRDDAPSHAVPNVEVKYNLRSRRSARKGSPSSPAKYASHEPVKQTLLRLPSPQMPFDILRRPLRDLHATRHGDQFKLPNGRSPPWGRGSNARNSVDLLARRSGLAMRRPGLANINKALQSMAENLGALASTQPASGFHGQEAPRPMKNFFLSSTARLKVDDKRRK